MTKTTSQANTLFVILILLNAADAILTTYGLTRGFAEELNPAMVWLIANAGLGPTMLGKLILIPPAAFYISRAASPVAILACIIAYAVIVLVGATATMCYILGL